MDTPVFDFLKKYMDSDMLRCHMPGHKGRTVYSLPEALFRLDITEISGADSLFEAEGIIAESERNMSRLYGTAATVYSAGGSTLCIQAMLALMKQENRHIFAVRNVHRAFLNAAALLGIDVEWIMPVYSSGILSGQINFDMIENKLAEYSAPACLYVTSPDYTGTTADITHLSRLCHKYGAKLIIDNAHGAHSAFFTHNMHPIALGADLCCDSAHKMLPSFTGAAMLHSAGGYTPQQLKQAMSLFGSTSPSYLIMASLDLCTDYIEKNIRADIRNNIGFIDEFKQRFSDRLCFSDGDPFHITIKAGESGMSGEEMAGLLRKNGVECEYADREIVILLMSPLNSHEDYIRLENAVSASLEVIRRSEPFRLEFSLPEPVQTMSIRQAVFSTSEEIPVENSRGRICASVKVPCPPAVPIAVSGEVIAQEHINIFKSYGIPSINVVK